MDTNAVFGTDLVCEDRRRLESAADVEVERDRGREGCCVV